MTGILQELDDELKKTDRICKFAKLIQALTAEEQAELQQALQDRYETTAIQRVLRKRSIDVSYTILGRHRRGECICGNI